LFLSFQSSVDGTRPEAYLNVYSEQEWECDTVPNADKVASPETSYTTGYLTGGSTPSLDKAAQNCRMLELGFVPYQLSHAKLPMTEEVIVNLDITHMNPVVLAYLF
jgi:hypothetical protein